MSAYAIFDIAVTDPARYEDYKKLAPASIEKYGGKYLTRGGAASTLEGDWSPSRVVILQFESVDKAKQWIDSPEYREARALRQQTSNANVVVVEGL